MTLSIDWGSLTLGFLAGTLVSLLFFAGLAFGMRVAMRVTHTIAVLFVSAGVRIALLLAMSAVVASLGVAAAVGFASAFLLTRLVIVARVRRPASNTVSA